MNRPFVRFLVLFLLCSYAVQAQKTEPVSAKVDRDKILIGEQFDLILDARFPDITSAKFFQTDTFPHFEIINRAKIDTANVGNEVLLSQRITLTSWDSGKWLLPAVALLNSEVKTKPIPVTVSFSPFDPNQDYHDVKDISDVKPPVRKDWYWYVIGAVLLLILFLILFPKKKKPVVENPIDTNAYKKALAELDKLKKEDLAHKDVKGYYVALIDVFRRYLQQGKGIHSFSKTSDDLIVQLRSLQLPSDVSTHLFEVLRLSDAVKFAKLIPDEKENDQSFIVIQKSIEVIESK
jgi:hypothetical protein